MRVFLASVVDDPSTNVVRDALAGAGHAITPTHEDSSEISDCDAVVALVSSNPDAQGLMCLWGQVESARANGLPVLGAALGSHDGLPAAVAAIPHQGAWIRVGPAGDGVASVLAALEALTAEAAASSRTDLDTDSEYIAEATAENGDQRAELTSAEGAGADVTLATNEAPERSAAEAGSEAALDVNSDSSRLRHFTRRIRGDVTSSAIQPDRPLRVFLSYSRREKLAGDVCTELQRHGYDVWLDKTSIPGAADWRVSITRAIRQADVFVLLLSPQVAKSPKYVWEELGLAQTYSKQIVPVRLRRVPTLPEGFDLVLSGLQFVDLFPDFGIGIGRLLVALGNVGTVTEPRGIRARVRRSSEQARRLTHEHEIGRKAKKYGGAALAGAAVAAVALGKAMADQQEAQRQAALRQQSLALEDYVKRTRRLLTQGLEEIRRATGMSQERYRVEFRPKFMRILGQLEGIRPDSTVIAERHTQLVNELQQLLNEFDDATDNAAQGDWSSFQRSVDRLNEAWANTSMSTLEWLREVDPAAFDAG